MMVLNVLFCGKMNRIQVMRIPHTPMMVMTAGMREIPNPLRYPLITS